MSRYYPSQQQQQQQRAVQHAQQQQQQYPAAAAYHARQAPLPPAHSQAYARGHQAQEYPYPNAQYQPQHQYHPQHQQQQHQQQHAYHPAQQYQQPYHAMAAGGGLGFAGRKVEFDDDHSDQGLDVIEGVAEEEEEESSEEGKEGEPKPEPPSLTLFKVNESYFLQSIIGEGAYGLVAAAVHLPSDTPVAIKRIKPFDHAMFAQRTLREIKLLRHFSHENVIAILDIILPADYASFNEVYLVQELMETDLHRVIRTQQLSDDHCQYFLYQAIRGLKALHTANVLHRDLKPSNLLLNANCDLKICDFGLARSAAAPMSDDGGGGFMTEYVATRWYRAPEVMLSLQEYTKAIDMWSIGCILAEMVNGKPLFPGSDYRDQLNKILDVVGTPNMDDFNEITSEKSKMYLQTLPMTRRRNIADICPRASPRAIDLLKRCLTFSPRKRCTVEQALAHPYMDPYHDPADEPGSTELPPEFFTLPMTKENESRNKEMLKRAIWEEIQKPILDYGRDQEDPYAY